MFVPRDIIRFEVSSKLKGFSRMGPARVLSPSESLRRVPLLGAKGTSEVWDRIPNGPEWDDFFARLWRYQWTRNEARDFIERAIAEHSGTTGHQLWQSILANQWPEIRDRMLQDNPDGRLLRSNSPFSHIIGITDVDVRKQLWRQAKTELTRGESDGSEN